MRLRVSGLTLDKRRLQPLAFLRSACPVGLAGWLAYLHSGRYAEDHTPARVPIHRRGLKPLFFRAYDQSS